jgi:hypothetical protein
MAETPAMPAKPAKELTPAEQRRQQAIQVSILVAICCVLLNVTFYFVADLYYADRARKLGLGVLADLPSARRAFVWFTLVVGGASVAAAFLPRITGFVIAGLASLASFVGAWGAWKTDVPGVLAVSLVLLGLVIPLLIWRALAGSRAAWAFSISLLAVSALVMLFGAPKVRSLTDIGLWYTMIVPGLLAVGTAALAMLRDDYKDERKGAFAIASDPAAAAPLDPAEIARRRKVALSLIGTGVLFVFVFAVQGMILTPRTTFPQIILDFGFLVFGLIAIVIGIVRTPRVR